MNNDQFSESVMDAILQSAADMSKLQPPKDAKDELTSKEFIQIYCELLNVMKKHNISYRCGCRIAVAMADAFMSGAVDLYLKEFEEPLSRLHE